MITRNMARQDPRKAEAVEVQLGRSSDLDSPRTARRVRFSADEAKPASRRAVPTIPEWAKDVALNGRIPTPEPSLWGSVLSTLSSRASSIQPDATRLHPSPRIAPYTRRAVERVRSLSTLSSLTSLTETATVVAEEDPAVGVERLRYITPMPTFMFPSKVPDAPRAERLLRGIPEEQADSSPLAKPDAYAAFAAGVEVDHISVHAGTPARRSRRR
jgi:hypothetical protein